MTRAWEIWEQLHIVERLWQMSLLAGLLVGFVLILRLLLCRYSKGYSYGLWLLVLLRLLCPIFIESDYSAQPLFLTGAAGADQAQSPAAQAPRRADGVSDKKEVSRWAENGENADIPDQMHVMGGGLDPDGDYAAFPSGGGMDSRSAFFTGDGQSGSPAGGRMPGGIPAVWLLWLRGVYVSGVGILLAYFAVIYIGWKRKLRDAVHLRDNIWNSEKVTSPFVLGALCPRIYLPYGLNAEEENHILLHEQSHVRHMDPLLRLLGTFALCLHWWNPLVWLGIHLFYQDMEMFCDETAMAQADLSGRRAYSATLLQFALRQRGPAMVLAFGETHTERRIRNVLQRKKRGKGVTFLVALAAVSGGLVFLTVPQGVRTGMTDEDVSGDGQSGQQPVGAAAFRKQETMQDFVLSEGRVEAAAGNVLTLRLVLTEGTYTGYQTQESALTENYEGIYELQTLNAEGQLLDRMKLTDEQGGSTMKFAYRNFPWYFEDYNLDGQLDFFLGTKAADGRSYHYLFTVTAEGGLQSLFDGPMWESYIPMTAEDITRIWLESGGEHDFREMVLYQADAEYSSHDFYNWSPYVKKYRKSVDFTGVHTNGWAQEAADYLEGEWRISGIGMWNQEQARPDGHIGEILSYTDGVFRRLDAAGDVAYESNMAGCSTLVQSAEEFLDTFNMGWLTAEAEEARRILVNLGGECDLGNVIYVLSDNCMLVYELGSSEAFWTATRAELRGEAARVQEYLQGTWEITGIAGRPYEALATEEAEAFLGTKLTYDWQNTANEYAIEGRWDYRMPIQGFSQFKSVSTEWLPESELPEGELSGITVDLGEGEFFGIDMFQMDADTMWVYYEGTFFVAERGGV